jgi:hypothetical protein
LYFFTDWHVNKHLASSAAAVPIPKWATLSRENSELDVFEVIGSDFSRCNAVLLLHDTSSSSSSEEVAATLESLPSDLPVTLVGIVPSRDVSLGPFGLNQANYHLWMSNHATLAAEYPSVYATTFASPGIYAQGFHALYTSQSSVLYPKSRLAGPRFKDTCDAISPVWDGGAVERFGAIASIPPEEQEQLLNLNSLFELLTGLAAVGKADVVWAWLRAHGYNGQLDKNKWEVID